MSDDARPAATPAPAAAGPAATAPEAAQIDVGRILRIATEVVAPITLITALLYFFGLKQMTFFYGWFGVEISSLRMTTADYLLLAQDGLLVPLIVVSAGVLVTLWVRGRVTGAALGPRTKALAEQIVAGLGGLLTVFGLAQAFWPGLGLAGWVPAWVAPLCLAGGVLVLGAVVRRRRRTHPAWRTPAEPARLAEWGAGFALVAVALFWAAGNYSAAVGTARAHQFVRELPASPGVVVRSTTDLGIAAPGVTAAACPGDGYRYRYDGMVLMIASADRYLLVPRDWTPDASAVIAVPVSDDVRLDHLAPPADGRRTTTPADPCAAPPEGG
ncbi:hypothetical protein [Myceligenerans crystallogenes]|uniref:Uncharacterized protein n=1 Tax=Myceligenerans crystallogenes TaxID=316335 RepID=A0ABN2NEK2_9MICO